MTIKIVTFINSREDLSIKDVYEFAFESHLQSPNTPDEERRKIALVPDCRFMSPSGVVACVYTGAGDYADIRAALKAEWGE